MRLKSALALVLLGLLTLLLGIGQKTFWAPSSTITASASADVQDAPLTVVKQALRTSAGSTVEIKVKGDGNFLLATARPDDVDAWVGKTAHNTVESISEDKKSLNITHSDGDAKSPNPAGADLWASSESASGELTYNWTVPGDGDWDLLIASDGTKPAPKDISFTVANDTSTPWAIPLIVLGGILVLAGIALVVLNKNSNGKRGTTAGGSKPVTDAAPAKGAGSANGTGTLALIAIFGLSGAAALGGASAASADTATPAPSASSTAVAQDSAPDSPVVLDTQLKRILDQTVNAVGTADAAKDAKKLTGRVAGTALTVRTQNYKIRAQSGNYTAVAPVTSSKLLTTVIGTSRAWPRQIMAVTQGSGNPVPQLLTLTQAGPRENYKLVSASYLLPGNTFPNADPKGAAVLKADSKDKLQQDANSALNTLGDKLSNNVGASKAKFPENAYFSDTAAYQKDLLSKSPDAVTQFAHVAVPADTKVFRTEDGGALVIGHLKYTVLQKPKSAGDKLLLDGGASVLAGGKETTKSLRITYDESVAVYVPSSDSKDTMKLIAATRGLVGATFE
ncbi:hypothetical protein ACQR35_05615 [Pseudarthrobacter sp. J1738]|uniref:hypothetical protein n=1 Tax=unclassified Pseudarthrobacter TaxID=2647000 RepID=UPI003D2C9A57